MDLDSLSQLARTQGPIFWAATVSIALGATLLVVALVQHLRRRLERASRLQVVVPAASVPPAATDRTAAAADVYRPAAPSLAGPIPAADTARAGGATGMGEQSLALLLRRLQAAGDHLEELAGDLVGENPLGAESGLKDATQDVEYVFRASGP